MSELASNAVSGNDKQAFSDFRKLTALGIAMTAGETAGAAAAMIADKAVFQKTVEVAVGKGIMRADEAVEAMIDRTASHMAVGIRIAAAKALTVGCVAAGTWLGGLIGQPVIGAAIGSKIAAVLNAPVMELVEKGVEKIKEVAKTGWQKVKAGVTSVLNKVSNWLFG